MAQDVLQFARGSIAAGRADLAITALRELTERERRNAAAWKLLGHACHEEQLEPEAAAALARAAALDDRDVQTALAHAQSAYHAGFPAVDLFQHVMQLAPGDLNALRGYASALAVAGQSAAAAAVLHAAVKDRPDWLEGHRALATLRYTGGDQSHFADSYASACAAQPHNLALRMAWFRAVAQTRDWTAASAIIDSAERLLGRKPQLLIARLFVASESGDTVQAQRLFADTASLDDLVRDLALIRHCLRTGELETAETTAVRHVDTASAAVVWPYLSLVWRLLGSPRAEWLDGSPPYVRAFELDFSAVELDRIADLLRQLHTARSPFVEQSVRGGTQTDQNLLLRHEPVLRDLRVRIQAAVGRYVAQLPPPVPGHPLLGIERADPLRGRVFFSGSWSVRLTSQGYNVSHTHPLGWISSALYISLPTPAGMGPPPAGWLQFGTPPAELNLQLQPCLQVEPRAGHLLLFPSRMWHSTVPFADGERLVVAFDVRAPRASALAATNKQRKQTA